VLAVFNFSGQAQRVPLPRGEWRLMLASDSQESLRGELPAYSTFIFIGA
jgi:hypothetical protein